jgi:hypothetical protein
VNLLKLPPSEPWAPAANTVWPAPLIVPLVQASCPANVTSPDPVSVPPLKVKVLSIVEAEAMASEPPERTRAFWLVRLWMESEPEECVIVMLSGTLMMTSSLAPGIWPPLQLLAPSQVPLAWLIQETMAGANLSSSHSNRRR